jgi:asparagine synthase (glutamine-hydrolysing)
VGELRREVAAFRGQGRSARAAVEATIRPLLPLDAVERVRARRGGGGLVHADLGAAVKAPPRNASAFRDRLRRALELQLTATQLPELLRYEDRNSMAHSIEARVPFLDVRLVELAFSLDGGDLIDRGRTKAVLRDAVAPYVPAQILARTDKMGFVTPERSWLRGALGEQAADVFASQSFRQRGFVDADAALAKLNAHRSGERTAGFELWRALSVELWARQFLDAAA